MSIDVNHSVTGTFTDQATVAQLIEFIDACEKAGMPMDAKLTVNYFAGNPMDSGYTTITVRQK